MTAWLGDRRWGVWAVVAAATVVAAGVRTIGLGRQGLLLWDEGSFLNEARYWIDGLGDLDAFVSGAASGQPPFYARPTHVVLQSLALLLLGHHAWAGQAVAVLFGVASVVLVFALGRSMFGTAAGVASAVVLAVCPLHVLYSRTALSVIDGAALYYGGIYLWWRVRRADAWGLGGSFLAGLVLGLAGTTQYPLWPLTPVPAVLEFGLSGLTPAPRRWGRAAARSAALLIGVALPLLAWQGVFVAFRQYAVSRGLGFGFSDYFGQLRVLSSHVAGSGATAVRITDPWFYVYSLTFVSGALSSLLLAFGLALFVLRSIRRSPAHLAVLALLAGELAVFAVASSKALRQIAIFLPAVSLVVGACWGEAWRLVGPRGGGRPWYVRALGAALAVVVVLAVADESRRVGPLLGTTSAFEPAVSSVSAGSARRLWSTQPTITEFYARSPYATRLAPSNAAQLWTDADDGYRYVLIDPQSRIYGFNVPFLEAIERGGTLVFSAVDAYKAMPFYVLDQDPTGLTFHERLGLAARLGDRPRVAVFEVTPALLAALPRPPWGVEAAAAGPDAQVVVDSSFEELGRAASSPWQVHGTAKIAASGSGSRPGGVAVCTGDYGRTVYTQVVPAAAGRRYVLGEWLRSSRDRDQQARLQVNWVTAAGGIAGVSLRVVPTLPQWRYRGLVVEAPAGTVRATVVLTAHVGGDVCFDDVTMSPAVPGQ
jgi:4-amino-4-deoxy-L-arabinose transferase-like glycosyltransferase